VTAFAVRRLGAALFSVAAVVLITFILIHAAPGEPMLGGADERRADPRAVQRLRSQFGLDAPVPVQAARWAVNVTRGNLGESFVQRRPVAAIIAERLPATMLLALSAMTGGFLLGIAVALLQARAAGSWSDGALGFATLVFFSMPSFWLALLLIMLFGQILGWLPLSGMVTPGAAPDRGFLAHGADVLRHLVLPATTLALVMTAMVARYQRGALVDTLAEPWVRAARGRGLGERRVLLRHALRASLSPAITLAGTLLPALLAGSVLVETVFGWPGMGRLAHDAIQTRDYNLIVGTALVAGVLVALGNLAADLATAALDPRQRP
jgi:peptide/nickel transport system permease protein